MKRPYKIVLWTIGAGWLTAIVILVVPMLVTAHQEARAVRAAFSEYGTLLVDQQFNQAYQYCGGDFRRAMSYDQFADLYQNLEQQHGNLETVTLQAFQVHGSGTPVYWRAVIDADFVYQKQTLRFEFVFHKETGRWLIFGFEQL